MARARPPAAGHTAGARPGVAPRPARAIEPSHSEEVPLELPLPDPALELAA